jgi:hypothetical protein
MGQAAKPVRGRGAYRTGIFAWADYCEHEFHMRKAHAYRLLQAAQVVNHLASESLIGDSPQVTSQVPESEAIARELVPLLDARLQSATRRLGD